jgi:hypothetical protein
MVRGGSQATPFVSVWSYLGFAEWAISVRWPATADHRLSREQRPSLSLGECTHMRLTDARHRIGISGGQDMYRLLGRLPRVLSLRE